ncbi:conserved hypothetical protein [Neospora caninum Liverpool]|uniref:RecQ-mediated genome instability protein 1 n=1 Tax=Neospora caninum (strain Liverpool) TaxID=572307 RepID=F0VC11_NEOCL|nr:conserved hypothetical protein [Neospora caninum Liverpool]CBZ51145.1 conserved hypothetical protein [Neospora caninum Liverpool]CEL68454.1 TPA: hypothetical protein BN1204_042200 [Neospora caninum Liverpool]|eukprot:XP_003881178.1 conserved hypothetical protein [Neospora caninum Liverpool]
MARTSEDLQAQSVCDSLQAKGLLARVDWVSSFARSAALSSVSVSSFSSSSSTNSDVQPLPSRAPRAALSEERVGDAFLRSDFSQSASPSLPSGVCTLERGRLEGVHLVEVVEAVNISESRKARTKLAPSEHRCLKLILSDGHETLAAVEYRKIAAFSATTLQRGAKLLLFGAPEVRRGLVLLQEANVRVVWGGADEGEAEGANAGTGAPRDAGEPKHEHTEKRTDTRETEEANSKAQPWRPDRGQPSFGERARVGGVASGSARAGFSESRSCVSGGGSVASPLFSESFTGQLRNAETAQTANARGGLGSGVRPPRGRGVCGAGAGGLGTAGEQPTGFSSFSGTAATQTRAEQDLRAAVEIDELAELDIEDLEALAVSADPSGVHRARGLGGDAQARRGIPERIRKTSPAKRDSCDSVFFVDIQETDLAPTAASSVDKKQGYLSPLSVASSSPVVTSRKASLPSNPSCRPDETLHSPSSSPSSSSRSCSTSSAVSGVSVFRRVSVHTERGRFRSFEEESAVAEDAEKRGICEAQAPETKWIFAGVTAAKLVANRSDCEQTETRRRRPAGNLATALGSPSPTPGLGWTDTAAGVWRLQLSDGAAGQTAFVGSAVLPALLLPSGPRTQSRVCPSLHAVLADREQVKRSLLSLQGHFLLRQEAAPAVSTARKHEGGGRGESSAPRPESREDPEAYRSRGGETSPRFFVTGFRKSLRASELDQELEELLEAFEGRDTARNRELEAVDSAL